MNEIPNKKDLEGSGKEISEWMRKNPELIKINGKWYRIKKTTRKR